MNPSPLARLRNPGLFSFLIFLVASLMVVALYKMGAPDALKLAAQLIGLLVTGFGARSAFASPPQNDTTGKGDSK